MTDGQDLVEYTRRNSRTVIKNAQRDSRLRYISINRNQIGKLNTKITHQAGKCVELRDDRCLRVLVVGDKVRGRVLHGLELVSEVSNQTAPNLALGVGRERELGDNALNQRSITCSCTVGCNDMN